MIDNIKSYKDLSSDAKQARKSFSVSVCTGCFINKSDKIICDKTMYAVCINAYTKGFVRGVKHHRKTIKERTENKISKICKLSYKEIKEKLIKYFKDYDYGYFAEVPREDIIEFLNKKL